jgi:hypothetical protein
MLGLVLEQAKLETKDEKECVNGLEHKLAIAYEKIPNNA